VLADWGISPDQLGIARGRHGTENCSGVGEGLCRSLTRERGGVPGQKTGRPGPLGEAPPIAAQRAPARLYVGAMEPGELYGLGHRAMQAEPVELGWATTGIAQ
jgi:hypothetical protein